MVSDRSACQNGSWVLFFGLDEAFYVHRKAKDGEGTTMVRSPEEKEKLLGRIDRLVGQLEAVRKKIMAGDTGDDQKAFKLMQQIGAARGELNRLIFDMASDHLEMHVLHETSEVAQEQKMDRLLKLLASFSK